MSPNSALKFLKDGQSFKVDELRLGAEKPGVIEVTGWSKHRNFSNLSKVQCLKELKEIKSLFNNMVAISPELKNFTSKDICNYMQTHKVLEECFLDLCGDVSPLSAKQIGCLLKKRKDRVVGDYVLRGKQYKNKQIWRVEKKQKISLISKAS